MTTQWRVVPGFPNYEVGDNGVVRRLTNGPKTWAGKIMSTSPRFGYPRVGLCRNGKQTAFSVHEVVMLAFVGPRPTGWNVNHKNGVKTDNRLKNLEYVTPAENTAHARDVLGVRPAATPRPASTMQRHSKRSTVESWRPIAKFVGKYEVSNRGVVRRVNPRHKSKALIPCATTITLRGYQKISLYNGTAYRTTNLHNLVAEAFMGHRPAGYQIVHLDGNPSNNRVENLAYATPAWIMNLALVNGAKIPQRGEGITNSKLTESDVRRIRKMVQDGASLGVVARAHGVSRATIGFIRDGKIWRHVL